MRRTVLNVLSISGYVLLAVFTLWFYIYTHTKVAAEAGVPFDHSNCQYPPRLSNPPDGCDNSDPAHPECMKYGTEECATQFETNMPIVAPANIPVEQVPMLPNTGINK